MSELETGSESGVSPEGSASPETASPAQSQEAAPQQDAEVVAAPKETPFHEHPRFKELIEERNREREERSRLSQQIQQMQAALQKQTQPVAQKSKQDQLLERLASIDPEFAEFQKGIHEKLSVAEQVQQELQEMKMARESEQALSQFNQLCQTNKVSDKDKFLYQQTVANMANSTGAKVSDLPNLFKQAHEQLSKYFEERDRSQRESYVADKTRDKRPASQTGGIPASNTKSKGISTLDDVKAELAKRIRAAQNI